MVTFADFDSGLVIIWTIDEVAFIQNLVFYIQTAYRTPVRDQIIFRAYYSNYLLVELKLKGCEVVCICVIFIVRPILPLTAKYVTPVV